MTHPWTAPDTPYIAAAKRVEVEIANAKDPLVLLNAYRSVAQQSKDPVRVYAMACAALLLTQSRHHPYLTSDDLRLFEEVDPLNVHQYASLRFALNLQRNGDRDKLYVVGMRLFKRNPKNEFVAENLIDLLCQANKLDDALSVAVKFTKVDPKFDGAYARLGQTCDDLWHGRHDKKFARMAIAAYTKYLQTCPQSTSPDDVAYRRWVRFIITEYQKELRK